MNDLNDLPRSKKALSCCIFTIVFLLFSQSGMTLTISSGNTIGVPSSYDPSTNTTIFAAIQSNANLNNAILENALTNHNVSVRDSFDQDIVLINGTTITWNSGFNLSINGTRNILINNQAQITSQSYGNLVLRADAGGNNEGTVRPPPNGGLAVAMNGGGYVKIFYRPINYLNPTDFSSVIYTTKPEFVTAYMAINSIDDLQNMSQNLTGNYALARNIDALGSSFLPIGTQATPFAGIFDGQGYRINRLSISLSGANYVGLFGYTRNATIENIGLSNISVLGGTFVGGLVGYSLVSNSDLFKGNIRKTFVTGNISGNSQVGGLVGYLANSTVAQSFSSGAVQASSGVTAGGGGGLIGFANGAIVDSYTSSRVTPSSSSVEMGGLFGSANNVLCSNDYVAGEIIPNSYAGAIMSSYGQGSFLNMFWDKDSTGRLYPSRGSQQIPGITGLNTPDMIKRSTYVDAGWDFDAIWNIDEGRYPHLRWTTLSPPWTTMPENSTLNAYKIVN